jgi:GNAT superfamily N-acetyltransferase
MPDWIDTIVAESVRQYVVNWKAMARSADLGAVVETARLEFAIAGTSIPLFNLAMAKAPFPGAGEAAEAAAEAVAEFRRRGVPGMLTAPASWWPSESEPGIEAAGMRYLFSLMGMRTARLNDPTRAIRAEVREFAPDEAVEALARVNGIAYGMEPAEWAELRLPRFWTSGPRAYGVLEGSEVAAVGAAATSERVSYVMWMATLPRARGKGYAEAILRRAWADAQRLDGAAVSVLHATRMGRPVYARLGYVAVAEFPAYLWTGSAERG